MWRTRLFLIAEVKTVKTLLFAITLSLLPVLALAQNETPLNVRNAGAASCANFAAAFSESGNALDKTAYMQWVAGYSAAAARSSGVVDIFPILDTLELVQMVIFVCNENQEWNLEFAVFQTVVRLRPFWVRESANVLTLNWEESQARFFEASVPALQEALNSLGANITVDGVYGNQTGAALTQLSTQSGLPPSPLPTGATLYLLTRPAE